ncbi:MAG: FKBP-type peptidyl-prolyl cis-trans isomerase [Bacteroidales bacterium]|jgi:FKBP-type peptidyl-prolyl cis-trans isomerase FkpA
MIKKYYQSILLFTAVALMISFGSCDPAKKYEKAEKEEIQNFLNSNDTLNYELKPSGLYYLEVLTGTGRTPVMHDTAYIFFTGMFLNGNVFYTNVGTTDTLIFPVAEGFLIYGFDEGITYMKAGGKASLLVPSKLAFGSSGDYTGTIGGYTPLLYDVDLVRVKPGPGK